MEQFSEYMKVFLQIANIVIILYGGYKFLGKPHSSLEKRVATLEKDILEVKTSLARGNKRFIEQDMTNEVITQSVLALIEFEMEYCLKEHKEVSKSLELAKEKLHLYLAAKKGTEL